MADVFISYSQRSRDSAEVLAKELAERGIDVWWDTRLSAGQPFDNVIRTELEAADAVIVIWSPESIESTYVRMEAGIAFAWDKLVSVRTADLVPEKIPSPFRIFHADLVTDIDSVMRALGEKGVESKGRVRRKRMTVEEILAALAEIDPQLPDKLKVWLGKCQSAGFRVSVNRSLMIKYPVPGLNEVNFGTLLPDGTLQTNYISDSAERIGAPQIAADYLDGVAALLEGGSVRRDGKPWGWRVDAYGALPQIAKVLERGDEWLELMKSARRRFLEAASAESQIAAQ